VRLFDIRKFRDSRNSSKSPKPLGTQIAGLSVSSAFFSPSGKSLLTTSFANRLDLTEDAHLVTGGKTIKPTHSFHHNNKTGRYNTRGSTVASIWCMCTVNASHTIVFPLVVTSTFTPGRWLTTFQATWHPELDIFCSGSMKKPRCMEVFDSTGTLIREVTGEALGSVMSRTCFHPSTNKLIMVGGNSSGRVVAVR
jgi:hypothetical protein